MRIIYQRKILIGSFMILFMMLIFVSPFFIGKAHSFSTEAPPGVCGAPGDNYVTCRMCHTGPAAIILTGAVASDIPASGYVPGNTYTISAKIRRPGHVRFGFEVSPQDSLGNQIGVMSDLGPETTFAGFGKYITHSSVGTNNSDSAGWFFQWTAPPAGTGNFTFWGAFNATDNNGSNVNDTILLSELFVIENTSASVADDHNPFSNLMIVQNNFNQIAISFQMPTAANLTISLFDLQGKHITDLFQGFIETKSFNENLDLPGNLSSGIYFVKINSGNNQHAKKIFLSNQ